jgi:hypothetical protein
MQVERVEDEHSMCGGRELMGDQRGRLPEGLLEADRAVG